MKNLKENLIRYFFLALAIVAAANLIRNLRAANPRQKSDAASNGAILKRGEYLVGYGGCADCHTPKKMGPRGPEDDTSRWLSGYPEDLKLPPPPAVGNSPWIASTSDSTEWAGPWGISYAANLTPDVNTGLGIWTEDMFVKAMRTGKHMGSGRDILPPMPWQGVAKLTDDDLKAIFAYLRSVPPVTNHVPTPVSADGKSFE